MKSLFVRLSAAFALTAAAACLVIGVIVYEQRPRDCLRARATRLRRKSESRTPRHLPGGFRKAP